MQVGNLMNSNVVSLRPEDTATKAAHMLQRHNYGCLPVCSVDGSLRGVVTDRDIVIRCIACDSIPEETQVREIMTRGVVTVTPETDVKEAARVMAEEQVRRLPVVEGGVVVGMFSLADMARRDRLDMEASQALSEISLPEY